MTCEHHRRKRFARNGIYFHEREAIAVNIERQLDKQTDDPLRSINIEMLGTIVMELLAFANECHQDLL